MFIDTHVHFNMEAFAEDRAAVIAAARQAGLEKGIVPGFDLKSSREAVAFAEEWPDFYAAIGIHPHHVEQFDATALEELRALARSEKVVAVGEFGLDLHRFNELPRERAKLAPRQVKVMREHLNLATELELPIIIHCRDLYSELTEILQARQKHYRGVIHSFTGTAEEVKPLLELGFYVAFNGIITFASEKQLPVAVDAVPLERMLLETDAPYLAPSSKRHARNESAFIPEIAMTIAQKINQPLEKIYQVTTQNAKDLFKI